MNKPLGLTLIVLLVTLSFAQPVVHLEGLDGLYFQHVGGSKDHSAVPQYLIKYVPEVISDTLQSALVAQVDQDGLSRSVEIRDFPLPARASAPILSLRQIVLGKENQRITELWWALYDSGRRSDVWYFTADPDTTDHKALSNYEIVEASPSSAELKLRVNASMFRPGGYWWCTGKTFTFSVGDKEVRFRRVLNNFGLFHSDSGREASLDVTLEHETNGRFEQLEYDHLSATAVQACKLKHPLDDGSFNWTSLENQARCLASRTAVSKRSYRNLTEPSFIERSAKPAQ